MTINPSLNPSLILESIAQLPQVKRWWLGFSGGVDSLILLHLAVHAGLIQSHQLTVIHVDHGLSSESEQWANLCEQECRRLNVPIEVTKVSITEGAGPEDQARQARYRAFEQRMAAGEGILLAHHADDQAETLLLRLMRGSGVRGLAAIPVQRSLAEGWLLRPLLSISRAEIEHYAQQNSLKWIEDPSNDSLDFDRNFIRHQVAPQLKQRWPEMVKLLGRSARYCAQADDLNRQLASIDIDACRFHDSFGSGLLIAPLSMLPRNRQLNLLRFWLNSSGLSLPEEKVLLRILDELMVARDDAMPVVEVGGHEVRRYRQSIYLIKSDWAAPTEQLLWDFQSDLSLAFGKLRAIEGTGRGLKLQVGSQITVGFRQGGERIKLNSRLGSQSLKKLMQDAGIPPWRRGLAPLVYVNGQLAAVLGVAAEALIAEEFRATEKEFSVFLCWQSY